MKITFHNLGALKEAEIDQRPLTVFVGPNNAGKTWAAYAIAGIFGPWGYTTYSHAYVQGELQETYPTLDNFVEQVIKTGSGTFDLVQFTTDYAEKYFNSVAHFVQAWMAEYMSTDLVSFENLDVSIDLSTDKANIIKQIINFSTSGAISGAKDKTELTYRKARGKKEFLAYNSFQNISSDEMTFEEQSIEPLPPEIQKEFLIKAVLRLLHRSVYPFVRIFPTERTTFIAHPYQIIKIEQKEEADQNQALQQRKNKSILGPLGYFLAMMQSTYEIETSDRIQRAREARNNQKIREYIALADLLEEILGGKVQYSGPSLISQPIQYPAQDVMFQPIEGGKLEISIASSMVKELSPLLFYLRYLAKPGELIIIDEPEMNLHPEAQVKIIEFLALLVNAGLYVLITTHSPYIVDHLTNLIKASEVEDKERVRDQFFLKRTDAFISKEKVMVYLFEQGQAQKAIDEEGVIELNSFGKISDRISEIYFTL